MSDLWLLLLSVLINLVFVYRRLPACMSVDHACQRHLVPPKVRRGHWVLWNWSYRGSWAMRVLGTELGSYGQAGSTFHCWITSPVLYNRQILFVSGSGAGIWSQSFLDVRWALLLHSSLSAYCYSIQPCGHWVDYVIHTGLELAGILLLLHYSLCIFRYETSQLADPAQVQKPKKQQINKNLNGGSAHLYS